MRTEFGISNALLGSVLGEMGFLDQAVTTARRGAEFAREQSTAFNFGWGLNFLARVYLMRGGIGETLATAEVLESLVEEHGLSDHRGRILIARGWATARKGQLTQNLEMMNLGLETLRAALNTDLRVEAQFAIAEAARQAGDAKAGFAALQTMESRTTMGVTFKFFKGHFLAMSGAEADVHEAEALFRLCLDHARKWQWKLRELNTAAGLSRLMARTGRRDEARAILVDTYNWFTEGFDTAPLRDARALLDELSG